MPSPFLVTKPAPPSVPGPADAEARAHALDITRSFLVEAPAGSGKTALILRRFLKLLATVESPDQVLAITFTRKATAELHDRVLTQLQNAAAQTPTQSPYETQTRLLAEAVLAHAAALGWNLLDNPHRLHIRTIDSLAMDIAAGLPVLSGSGGAQSPTTEPEPLYAEAAHRTLMQLGGHDAQLNRALESILLHRDGNLANCQSHIASMLAVRDQWGELIPIGSALDDLTLDEVVLPKLERALSLVICRGLTTLSNSLPPGLLEDLAHLGAQIGHSPHCTGRTPAEEAAELDHWNALVDLLLIGGGTYRKALNNGTFKVPLDSAHKAQLTALIDRVRDDEPLLELLCSVRALPSAIYPHEQWQLTKALFRVLSRALTELQLTFASRGVCDFAELGLLARAALRNDSALDDLRASSGMALQHLLVDEMQDTSTSQYELLHLLTESWDGAGQTVFLVGDPKQSIYLFRQARVERFLDTMHTGHLGPAEDALPLTTLHLTANFRSQRPLVEAFNHDFSRIFLTPPRLSGQTALQPEQVTYLPATPTRPATKGEGVPHDHEAEGGVIVGGIITHPIPSQNFGTTWHTSLQPYNSDTERSATLRRRHRRRTANEIRTLIQTIQARPLPTGRNEPTRTKPWTIAILVRNRIHLAEIVAALKEDNRTADLGETATPSALLRARLQPCHKPTEGIAALAAEGDPQALDNFSSAADPAPETLPKALSTQAPIPFRANEIDLLSERQEILDLISLTRALLHPADRTAWLALLRTPLCGLGLADLHTLAGEDDPELRHQTLLHLMDVRGDLLTSDGISRLQLFYPVITQALAQRGRQPLAQWVHQTWLAFASHLYATEEARSNVARFLRLLDELEEPGGTLSLPRLEQRMVRLYASPAVHPGAVDLMTIHGAKGLEWDFVIVPGLERIGMNTNGRLFDWIETGSEEDEHTAPGIVAPIRGKGIPVGKLNEWMRSLDKARSAAEVKRLYYVACTRAREELHLFATLELNSKGEQKPRSGSLLAAAWPAAAGHFASLQPTPIAQVPHSSPSSGDEWGEDAEPLALAASAEQLFRTMQRIPAPPFTLTSQGVPHDHRSGAKVIVGGSGLRRPQGNLSSRTVGNITHAFLEELARRRQTDSIDDLREELPTWQPRITTLLRASGLSPTEVQRQTPTILRALSQTLASETGQWILAPHPKAASEYALTSFDLEQDAQSSIRLDRTFLAGPGPLTLGQTHQWIVDYKTATHGPEGLEAWLAEQESIYRPQLERYARQFITHPLRLALYYPLLDRLLYWAPGS